MPSSSSLLNGERAVVLLFVTAIQYAATPLSFLYETLSFVILTLFAFFVEISVESHGSTLPFKTRPGASSGILLGAVTLPGLAVSKLIQLRRGLLVNEVTVEDVAYIRLQYWATSTRRYMTLSLLWVVIHGLAAVKFIQHVLQTFPACASYGEALLVTAGSVVYFGDMSAFTIAKFVQDFSIHPFLWVLKFVFSEPHKRLSLCIYWVAVISASVLRFYNISKNSKIERILLRKYYHLVAVLMFVPALVFQPSFLNLAFGAAFGVFLVLEIIRVWRIWPLGPIVHQFMNAFTDHRDSDLLIVSHFSLLLGCALPIWMSSGFNDRPLAPFAGILSLGIGDTMASMVGYKYGVLRWSKTGKKTVEGTAAGITSVLAACSALLPLLAATGHMFTQHWLSLLLAVTVSGLLEAYTAQLDNAFIPLVFYSLLCL
nr:dolichol kinase EVAN [Tanacetum cinerariifolium]